MNIFDFPQKKLPNEIVENLHENKNVRIEKIMSNGHTTSWYDQAEDEWVCLLTGEADIEFGDSTKTLRKGDTIFIPKHQRHRVSRTMECIWLCVFIGE